MTACPSILGVVTGLTSLRRAAWVVMRDCIRVGAPPGVCSGCFNRHALDAGDWQWCPEQKGTPRAFECTTSIAPERVIDAIRTALPAVAPHPSTQS